MRRTSRNVSLAIAFASTIGAQILACGRSPQDVERPLARASLDVANPGPDASAGPDASGAPSSAPSYGFDDGNDDPDEADDVPTAPLPARVRFVKVGTPPLGLTRICDLTSFRGELYAAHANQPLGTDGATITRYDATSGKFRVAFDWNRLGEPTKGGGGGQGFLRVHKIDGRLFVADADPPYGGLGVVDHGAEGYVFVSDREGRFAPARSPGHKPPAAPTETAAGASVLPRAYHVIDVAKYEGSFFASTGSVPPTERAWNGPSPGALHRARPDLGRWIYDVDYPFPYQNGVWRLTFLVRFRSRLYAGIQDYDRREPNDFVVFSPATEPYSADGGTSLAANRARARAVRVTASGAAGTMRWWVDPQQHRLYWIAYARDGVRLRATDDGDTWRGIDLPEGAGRPTDIRRFGDAIVILAERGLYRLDDDGTIAELGRVEGKKSPFDIDDAFCTAPLGLYRGALYAGGQRGGTLYRIEPE